MGLRLFLTKFVIFPRKRLVDQFTTIYIINTCRRFIFVNVLLYKEKYTRLFIIQLLILGIDKLVISARLS